MKIKRGWKIYFSNLFTLTALLLLAVYFILSHDTPCDTKCPTPHRYASLGRS